MRNTSIWNNDRRLNFNFSHSNASCSSSIIGDDWWQGARMATQWFRCSTWKHHFSPILDWVDLYSMIKKSDWIWHWKITEWYCNIACEYKRRVAIRSTLTALQAAGIPLDCCYCLYTTNSRSLYSWWQQTWTFFYNFTKWRKIKAAAVCLLKRMPKREVWSR